VCLTVCDLETLRTRRFRCGLGHCARARKAPVWFRNMARWYRDFACILALYHYVIRGIFAYVRVTFLIRRFQFPVLMNCISAIVLKLLQLVLCVKSTLQCRMKIQTLQKTYNCVLFSLKSQSGLGKMAFKLILVVYCTGICDWFLWRS